MAKMSEALKSYKQYGDKDTRDKVIEDYMYLVNIIAGRVSNQIGGAIEFDELTSFGIFGLMDSIEKFDISKNVKFETYAQIRIRGEIIDNIRRQDWVPRSLRTKSKNMIELVEKLEYELGREPTNKDIAKKMGKTIKEVEKLQKEVALTNLVSLEKTIEDGITLNISDTKMSVSEEVEKKEIKRILAEGIDRLDEREGKIISMYYYDDLTYQEIADIMNLSESRISQIHGKVILELKSWLESINFR